ncbi:MSHA biogenesis protein MshK [Pseudoduganella sp. SL102]|uniref:MSHA biogenesis protein MshK n=1 Tax=Pseudoduganella sp. SL102 TaxID=2995154 RepID=UPI00248D35BA|nr:MSHA biogenesis protein MshK [Pseudoduganella sp. SL102]WBR99832.1 MSHA biogenesis protein MshK [Pseudoduganella sp. SL102]
MDRPVACLFFDRLRLVAQAPAIALAIALAFPGGARAQVADPTLPPPGLDALAAGGEAPPVAPPGPELQSILVSREPGGRRIAVISGEMVRQGSRFQGALVESVGEDRVVLRRGKARETLRLYVKPEAMPARQE